MDPRAEHFRVCGCTQTTLGENCMKIHAYLTHTSICGANCVPHRTVCRWTEGFIAGKVGFKDGPRAEQFRFCGFTQMKLGDDCINTHSY